MKNLHLLNIKELKKLNQETEDEIGRRSRLNEALAQIEKIIHEHNISYGDLQPLFKRKAKQPTPKAKPKSYKNARARDRRKKVSPKYVCQSSQNQWSGRGRPPAWVKDICAKSGIDIAAFKDDPAYRIDNVSVGKTRHSK